MCVCVCVCVCVGGVEGGYNNLNRKNRKVRSRIAI